MYKYRCAWSTMGIHDIGWKERGVFGENYIYIDVCVCNPNVYMHV